MALMMASDASRRWLDDSGIWSCRIKLPQSQNDNLRAGESNQSQRMAPAQTIEAGLEPGSPSSRRNKGKIAEAIQSLGNLNGGMETLELPTDPDAQATVTDFLDFTEYLPADMVRSLTLVGNLDQTYIKSSATLHDLTKQYGKLPEMPAESRLDAMKLREDISEEVSQAVTARILSHAEAVRMDDNIERHCLRAKNILAKLMKMADEYPTSREGTPKLDTPELVRTLPKITLRTDGLNGDGRRSRKRRAPRITVPGEVLAPFELDYESWGTESDSAESDIEPHRVHRSPDRSLSTNVNKIKLKITKKEKTHKEKTDKTEKPPRGPRPPGTMGTNVHSAVAGISTSNALAKLKPPSVDAKPGDDELPWLELNPYELATLRKRMKKNAIWRPSDTMIARELAALGRGYDNYLIAQAEAEAAGQSLTVPPQLRGVAVNTEGAISLDALKMKDTKLVNRGMKLNEAKKLKKESLAKQAAEEAANEAEAAAKKMTTLKSNMANMFDGQDAKTKKTPAKTPSKAAANKKRKRAESLVVDEIQSPSTSALPTLAAKPPPLKRTKTETPVPVPQTPFAKQVSPIIPPESVLSAASPAPVLTPATETAPETLAPPVMSPKKSTTPILPPNRVLKKDTKKDAKETKVPEPMPATRSSKRIEEAVVAAPVAVPVPEPLPAKRPTSSRSKKASEEPTIPVATTSERSRRASTARNTPVPPEPHKMSRRTKRPPPGVVTSNTEGSTAAVGKRSKATRKTKAGAKKEKKDEREGSMHQEVFDEFDDEGNLIDPNEPRYCLCNRVSFGLMIECDNKDCEKEWFHLECVGLAQIPGKTTKWYCPECRVTLGLGPKGEVTARGKKK